MFLFLLLWDCLKAVLHINQHFAMLDKQVMLQWLGQHMNNLIICINSINFDLTSPFVFPKVMVSHIYVFGAWPHLRELGCWSCSQSCDNKNQLHHNKCQCQTFPFVDIATHVVTLYSVMSTLYSIGKFIHLACSSWNSAPCNGLASVPYQIL